MLKTDPPDLVQYITANDEISSKVIKADQPANTKANLIFEWFYKDIKTPESKTYLYLLDLNCQASCSVYRLQILGADSSIMDVKEIG